MHEMQPVFEEKSLLKVHVHCYTVPIFPLDHSLLLFLAPKKENISNSLPSSRTKWLQELFFSSSSSYSSSIAIYILNFAATVFLKQFLCRIFFSFFGSSVCCPLFFVCCVLVRPPLSCAHDLKIYAYVIKT